MIKWRENGKALVFNIYLSKYTKCATINITITVIY